MYNEKHYWFYRKRYGWGWGLPAAWEGWAVYAAYAGLFIFAFRFVQPAIHPVQFSVFIGIITLSLLAICWIKGEPPRWQWGDRTP